jgi:adenosylhomocysteinase
LIKNRKSLQKAVIAVPPDIDRQVAKIKLESMSVKIDRLTVEQEQYLANRFEVV